MATVPPPPSKRRRVEQLQKTQVQQDVAEPVSELKGSIFTTFVDDDGKAVTEKVEIPLADLSDKNLSLLYNTLLGRAREDFKPYIFRITNMAEGQDDTLVRDAVRQGHLSEAGDRVYQLSSQPQEVFRVQSVSRLAHRMPGHGDSILAAQFSPESSTRLATGSGDRTVRIWNTETGTPHFTLKGHEGWVLCVAWSPDGRRLATGGMDKAVRLWDPDSGKPAKQAPLLTGHAKYVTSLAWEPFHLWKEGVGPRLASASKDFTVRVWIANSGRTEHVLSGHRASVTCVRWGGAGEGGRIYTASQDKTVRVWDAVKGTLVQALTAHVHWVNHVALSTDFAVRTGFFDHTPVPETEEARRAKAKARFDKAAMIKGRLSERLVSASDDCQMMLWDPSAADSGKKPLARMVGHQKVVNHVAFSPDGTLIASASFDNTTKLWAARDGKFIKTLTGHVASVYQCAFSADSRLLVTGSKDTTLKVWSVGGEAGPAAARLKDDLPGHQDEVYAVDWSPDGKRVGSGGKDKAVRLWCS